MVAAFLPPLAMLLVSQVSAEWSDNGVAAGEVDLYCLTMRMEILGLLEK